jgi:hypothetical protein
LKREVIAGGHVYGEVPPVHPNASLGTFPFEEFGLADFAKSSMLFHARTYSYL